MCKSVLQATWLCISWTLNHFCHKSLTCLQLWKLENECRHGEAGFFYFNDDDIPMVMMDDCLIDIWILFQLISAVWLSSWYLMFLIICTTFPIIDSAVANNIDVYIFLFFTFNVVNKMLKKLFMLNGAPLTYFCNHICVTILHINQSINIKYLVSRGAYTLSYGCLFHICLAKIHILSCRYGWQGQDMDFKVRYEFRYEISQVIMG